MKQRMAKRTLSRQLLSGFGASLGVMGLIAGVITYLTLRQNLEHQIQERAESITHGLEFASEGVIESQDIYLLERIVQNYATLPTVTEISIVDPNGMILAHSDLFELNSNPSRRYASLHPTLAWMLQQVSHGGTETNVRTVLHGRPVVVHMLPFSGTLFNQNALSSPSVTQTRGVAIAVMDLQKIEQEILQDSVSTILIVLICAALLLVFMGWLIQRLVLAPLTQISVAVKQREGQDSLALPVLPNNEVGFLGTTLVEVLDQLRAYKQLELEIAERKYAEAAERYTLATRAAKVWVWDWYLESDTFIIDQEFGEWFGWNNLAIPCHLDDWLKRLPPDDRTPFVQALYAHIEGKTSEFFCEHRVLDASGNLHWFLSRGEVVQVSDASGRRAIGTIADIAERKQAEAQLQQTNEELIRATRLKDEFLANMSHELRTPLNAILGMAEGLQESVFGPISDEQSKAIQTIERSGAHLLELINDILDVAKIEAGQMELECTVTPISRLFQSSLAFIKQQAAKKRVQLETKLLLNVPDLLVDERRIRQVLINLLNNAVKFTPEGGRITLEVLPLPIEVGQPQFLRILIRDTGIGIAPEHLARLFQPFVQIDSALNRQYQGTGLGLALVKRIVDLHGGQVAVTSEVGIGSCFTIDLPCVSGVGIVSELKDLAEPGTALHQSHHVASPVILLAEDNEANVKTVSSYLRAKGYQIVLASNGYDAVALARSEQPDLILMDIQMPGMDGLEAMQQIRLDAQLAQVPIIALTALVMAGDRERCLTAGANDYLSKPIKLKQLATTIQQYLRPRNATSQEIHSGAESQGVDT